MIDNRNKYVAHKKPVKLYLSDEANTVATPTVVEGALKTSAESTAYTSNDPNDQLRKITREYVAGF